MSFKLREFLIDAVPVVRAKFDPKLPVVVNCGTDSKVQQHFKDQCDINNIAKNIEATGSSDMVRQARERYGDFSDVMDLAGNMQKMIDARMLFEQLPAEVKKRAGQSVEGLFGLLNDESNREFLEKWGVLDKKAPPAEPAPQSDKKGNLKKTKVVPDSSDIE